MLTVARIRSLKPAERPYKVSDGAGLYLNVSPTGARSWRYNYKNASGKARTLTLGQFPDMGLQDARIALAEAKRQIAKNIDPSDAKRLAARGKTASPSDTFAVVFRRWYKRKLPTWEPLNAERLEKRFKADVMPVLGETPVAQIGPQDVLKVIRAIEGRGSIAMARRIRGAMSEVFRFAVAEGLADRDPARDIGAALAPKPKVERRRALPPELMAAFMTALAGYHGEPVPGFALRFQILTLARPIEAAQATWTEFEDLDGEDPLWRIPAHRMKARREHIVPLSRQAVELIKEMRQFSGSDFVFEVRPGLPVGRNSLLTRVRALRFEENPTAHGFRSTGSTWANEKGFNRDAIELALAHVDSSIRGVYNRAPYLAERRAILQAWADFIEISGNNNDGAA
ncbi:tyrosine-type recombinase/integrase [Paracoccus sp. (in: a-proteobacteria)]|uniref:tyrosine-type recombinase/integrase n=1 Tax=Paracoccus sp. TaxID=267 RepID=UPI0040597ECD